MYNDEKKKESVRLSLAKQKMGKFEKDAKTLLDAIGGKENVSAVSHCATRMRFVLADEKKADVKAIEAIPAVKGTFTNAGQFQVIIGNDVPIFYNDFTAVSGIEGVSKEAAKAVETTSTIIENVSLDLIYGLPNQTLSDWATDIRQALQLPIKHLSSYALTIEEGTPLFQLQQKQIIKEVKEDITRAMYEMLMLQTEQAGMQHYEISNFAYPTYHSQHNHNYWLGLPYLGVGPGAHSYKGHTRRWNKSDLNHYLQHPGQPLFDFEQLNEDEHFNEMLLLRLRTKEGLSLNELKPQDRNYLLSVASPFIKQGYLHLLRENLYLSKHGIFISDYIISSLMKG